MSDDLILGIDGGGSKALIALADKSGRVIDVSRGEGINPIDNRAWRRGLEAQLQPFAGGRGHQIRSDARYRSPVTLGRKQ